MKKYIKLDSDIRRIRKKYKTSLYEKFAESKYEIDKFYYEYKDEKELDNRLFELKLRINVNNSFTIPAIITVDFGLLLTVFCSILSLFKKISIDKFSDSAKETYDRAKNILGIEG
ncbi:MAG: hypothetical protein ACYDEX_24465, partial [Mobilitalea sp.]